MLEQLGVTADEEELESVYRLGHQNIDLTHCSKSMQAVLAPGTYSTTLDHLRPILSMRERERERERESIVFWAQVLE